ncbi:glycoside hydrolase family 47 protein [Macrolepiota fuliginosa MF-IS2]|uniref:alpha-1,2-Mannosidase n=1 Tax=Macrolepiota fuliginosa MF-IS2 TaxID=1400762 RepID=A0A9P5XPX9_9AGAR|nr:glycoside hydrolase family 47 protein [Macrolepiota fuliginosa MF-IS2]
MVKRPLVRFIPLLIAGFVAIWLFLPPFIGPPSHIPHQGPYQFNSGKRPQQYRPYPPPPRPPSQQTQWEERAQRVRDAFVHAWNGYQKHAAGWDELTPIDGGKVNNFNGWGVTLYDALDTMWIMGLHDEFRDSLGLVAKTNFTLAEGSYAPFFETVIRYLGGLLSAYALSGEPVLLSRADDLGRMMLPAFNTTSGLPKYAVNTVTGKTREGWSSNVLWSEALSNQVEYKYLAHLTGRTEYFTKSENVMKLMYKADIKSGLYPTFWNMETGGPNSGTQHYSVGAYADSAHEYLLKQYLLTARSEPQILELYLNSINAVINNLLYITPTRHLLYVTDKSNGIATHKLEHLSCFFPGLLALGVLSLSTSSATDSASYTERDKRLHLWAASGLAETCWILYHDQKSGLGPDEVRMVDFASGSNTQGNGFHTGPGDGSNYGEAREKEKEGLWVTQVEKWVKEGRRGGVPPGVPGPGQSTERVGEDDPDKREYRALKEEYLLRPETVETFFYMWKLTGESKWRERGWSVFEAIEEHAKTKYGFASVTGVDWEKPEHKNEMPSFFMAETLKYLYILFRDEDIVSLKDWVFNTEAHPLPIFDWSPWEKQEYNIIV